jgi:secreted trypsin-like serine protease
VPPIALAQMVPRRAGAKVALIGWEIPMNHVLPKRRLEAYTVVVPQAQCEKSHTFNATSDVCTESEPGDNKTEACPGESGGPLITTGTPGSKPSEVGIVRAGVGRSRTPCYGLIVSTKVSAIWAWTRHWIAVADAAAYK